METQRQNLTMTQRNELLKLLQKFEDMFDGTLGTWKTDPVVEIGCKANLLATISSTKGTRINVLKRG